MIGSVVGGGGLIGSGLIRRSAETEDLELERAKIDWKASSPEASRKVPFIDQFRLSEGAPWVVVWSAGIPNIQAANQEISSGSETFQGFLRGLESEQFHRNQGVVVYISSLGGIYDQAVTQDLDEWSFPPPQNSYGQQKLKDELALRESVERLGYRGLSVRVPAVFGPSPNYRKNPGLINALCMSTVNRRPVNLFVPLETRRPYVFVDDLADFLLRLIRYTSLLPDGAFHLKNLLPHRDWSVAGLVGEFRNATRKYPPVRWGKASVEYPHGAPLEQIKSVELKSMEFVERTSLRLGIWKTYQGFLWQQRDGLLSGNHV